MNKSGVLANVLNIKLNILFIDVDLFISTPFDFTSPRTDINRQHLHHKKCRPVASRSNQAVATAPPRRHESFHAVEGGAGNAE